MSKFLKWNLDDFQTCTPQDLAEFVAAAGAGVSQLQKLRNENSLWFRNYGEEYAWIPAAELP